MFNNDILAPVNISWPVFTGYFMLVFKASSKIICLNNYRTCFFHPLSHLFHSSISFSFRYISGFNLHKKTHGSIIVTPGSVFQFNEDPG